MRVYLHSSTWPFELPSSPTSTSPANTLLQSLVAATGPALRASRVSRLGIGLLEEASLPAERLVAISGVRWLQRVCWVPGAETLSDWFVFAIFKHVIMYMF